MPMQVIISINSDQISPIVIYIFFKIRKRNPFGNYSMERTLISLSIIGEFLSRTVLIVDHFESFRIYFECISFGFTKIKMQSMKS